MKIIKYLLFACMTVSFWSCKQAPYNTFEDINIIQFGPAPADLYNSDRQLRNRIKAYTFVYEPDDKLQDTVYFDVYALGGKKNKDRFFKIEQEAVPDVENAVPGVHYQSFDKEGGALCVIKANTVHTQLPVVLLRDESLKKNTVVLKFKLQANEEFVLGEKEKLWREVSYTDQLSKPDGWTANVSRYYLGDYSAEKHRFMIKVTQQRWDEQMIVEAVPQTDLMMYYKAVLNAALIKYNNESTTGPLRDENRQLIVFPR
ncbi:DUF4843 domain-containing protein [Sphingobacterium faecale]|uniref:DUF4843 domain-containing protein n=1 Tax=Sphingobacterium faecale TaxID=2803775 RepID=A0ABS1R664_9SPHI|nr:DUF4843 domain-containing protein [Sphingobacterium faecale]MBL1409492.1 DUF4843 domain-containing protein [Sphingobacterium faecale]